jgi:hypothetical protein
MWRLSGTSTSCRAPTAPQHVRRGTRSCWASTTRSHPPTSLDLAMRAKRVADPSITIGFRPHPASASIDLRLYPGISLDSHDTLSSALAAADVAVCGSISSAAVDASGRGVTTVLVSDPRTFFTSPAEDRTGTVIIRTAEDLAAILDGAGRRQEVTASGTGFFLDASLPLWRALLSPCAAECLSASSPAMTVLARERRTAPDPRCGARDGGELRPWRVRCRNGPATGKYLAPRGNGAPPSSNHAATRWTRTAQP